MVKENIPLDPVDILCFSAYAVVAQADLITHLVEKLGFGGGVSGFGRRVFRTGRCLSRRSWDVSRCVSWCVHGQQFVMNLSIVLTSSQYTHPCVSVYTWMRLELPPGNTPREKVDCTEIGVHYTLGVGATKYSSCAGPPAWVLRAKHGSPWRLPAVACLPEPGPPGSGGYEGGALSVGALAAWRFGSGRSVAASACHTSGRLLLVPRPTSHSTGRRCSGLGSSATPRPGAGKFKR